MKREGYWKCLGILVLAAILIALSVWIAALYRSASQTYTAFANHRMTQAIDAEFGLRLRSPDTRFVYWTEPYKNDTAVYLNKTIEMEDTIIHYRIRKDDPTAFKRVYQFLLNTHKPINTVHLDSLFRFYMKQQMLTVSDSYVELIDLQKNKVLASSREKKPEGYYNITADTDTIDFFNTLAVKAYVKAPVLAVLKPVMFWLAVSVVFVIIAVILIIRLVKDVIQMRREGFRIIGNIARQNKQVLDQSAKEIKEVSDALDHELEKAEKLRVIYERLADFSNKNRKLELFLDNEKGLLHFCKTPVELTPLFYTQKINYEKLTFKKVTVSVGVDDDLIFYTDEAFFSSMVGELMNNAVKFSGGNVHIELKAFRDAGNLVVTVRDNGWGIHPDEIEFVFRPSYIGLLGDPILPKHMEGLGSGLPYVESLVRTFGGKIHIHSKQKEYTEVRLEFPITQDQIKAVQAFNLHVRKLNSLNSILL